MQHSPASLLRALLPRPCCRPLATLQRCRWCSRWAGRRCRSGSNLARFRARGLPRPCPAHTAPSQPLAALALPATLQTTTTTAAMPVDAETTRREGREEVCGAEYFTKV